MSLTIAIRSVPLAAAMLLLTGCAVPASGPDGSSGPAQPFRPCPAAVAGSGVSGPAARPAASPLPALSLPCLVGGERVALDRLGRPAVINLWASWCTPCRVELPELQRLGDTAGGRLVVLGVVSADTVSAAAAMAADLQIDLPAVFDPDEALRRSLGLVGLPVTLFVDSSGGVRYIYHSGQVLTVQQAMALARVHLGVELS